MAGDGKRRAQGRPGAADGAGARVAKGGGNPRPAGDAGRPRTPGPAGERPLGGPDAGRAARAGGPGAPAGERGEHARPAPTRADYARYARQAPEEIARDCEVQVFRATGPGGQGVNTTDSAVRMRHVPTGVTVVSRASRSQHQNRLACLEKLAAIFAQRARPPKQRVKTKVPHAQKERRLKAKHLAARKKELRSAPRGNDGW